MTYEELNSVWRLKRQITAKRQKVSALRESAEIITPKYTPQPKGKNVDSRVEILTALIIDEEAQIMKLQERLIEAVTELTQKLQAELEDTEEQVLMISRYVNCRYFRDIGFLMSRSEQWVYRKHSQILEKFIADYS